ncbi:hypothetical protein N7468_002989 [Penicillium chermesinum]|uniref:Major facilitator superfamily (MFS) profile domain-containing protein n=1 Tax=Penicillium chermesinum TaxID=63820 RepID=A0A9W9P5U1_9EURO|nr:uncharacterized protein N7468_002989 [Penicillium chermesinum]KAJ5238370.1 hypothetical protein N7468_002989 [Penicillium chermesinum]
MSPDRRHGRISTSLSQRSSPDTSSLFSIWPRQLMTWFITPSASKSSYTQVPQDPDQTQLESGSEMEASQLVKARLRTYWLATVLCCGGALFGYDSGGYRYGGVLTFGSFKESFQFTATQKTHISAIAVGIQQAGAFAGCFIIWPVTNRYGRRIAMMLCALVFCVGVILETVDSHSSPLSMSAE